MILASKLLMRQLLYVGSLVIESFKSLLEGGASVQMCHDRLFLERGQLSFRNAAKGFPAQAANVAAGIRYVKRRSVMLAPAHALHRRPDPR